MRRSFKLQVMKNRTLTLLLLIILLPGLAARAELIGEWMFNEGSGTTVWDSSGNNNNGTLVGNPSYVASPGGWAISYNGLDQYVSFGHQPLFNLTGAFSLEAWVKIQGVSGSDGEGFIVGKHTAFYGLSYYRNGRIYFYGGQTGGNTLSYAAPLDQWIHVVGVADATAPAPNMFLYVNGVLIDSRTSVDNPPDNFNNDLLSGTEAAFNGWLDAQIDEIRIYSHVLTKLEIVSRYNAGPGTAAPGNCAQIWSRGYGMAMDLNHDCKIDFEDFAIMAANWMKCNDPADTACVPYL
jgi:hypothetical protein